MLDEFSRRSTDFLIRNRVIDEEDRDVYEYGFHSLYNNIIDIASLIIISIWLRQVRQTILYHVSFVILRNTAGGFHAKTHFRCFIVSTAMWLISLWGISNAAFPGICVGLAALSVSLVWAKAPIEHENSPLSVEKRKRMKIRSRTASIVFFVAVLLASTVMNDAYRWIAASLAYGMASHAILILGALLQTYADASRF